MSANDSIQMTVAVARDAHAPTPPIPLILIESSEYWLRNNGDLAMFEVTISRLRRLCPQARIGVLTDTAALLHAYFPEAEAIPFAGARAWSEPGRTARLARRLGPRIVGPPALAWLRAKVWIPQLAHTIPRRTRKLQALALGRIRLSELRGSAPTMTDTEIAAPARARTLSANVANAVDKATLVLALGGGYLTDTDSYQSHRVLNLLEYAQERGLATALAGQGLGPIDSPNLARRVAEVLPSADFISLRESLRGPAILDRAGVPKERVLVTGDDAIELAHGVRQSTLGSAIGLCVRVADYSAVSDAALDTVRRVLHEVAREQHAPLAPLVIAEFRSQDRRSTLPLVRGYRPVIKPPPRYARPRDVAAHLSQCRVVVTGAYHLAVFALAQGIPVVALTSSRYYDGKFQGLAAMFGAGIQIIALDGDDLAHQLRGGIRSAWTQAPRTRQSLLESAAAQIAASQRAFEIIASLLESPEPVQGAGPASPPRR